MGGIVEPSNINVKTLLEIYEDEISKNVRNKAKLLSFEMNKIQMISSIIYKLKNCNVGHNKYNIFLIYEPKCRLVMSLSIQDKIINHYVTRYILEPKLSKYLDCRNVATRKGMGTDYAIKLVKNYLNLVKGKSNNFYALKLDIKKYFYSIDHEIFKKLLKKDLNSFEYKLVEDIIDSTNKDYINKTIENIINKKSLEIPNYDVGKGLPIGNMTSQFLSIFYLYKLDHFIVHDLKLKYFCRYMDDFLIIDTDLQKLYQAREIIIKKLEEEYKLNINFKKTKIVNCKEGFTFLGYVFKVINKKVIIKIKKENLNRIKKRIKTVKYLINNNDITHYQAFCSIMTYSNCYKYANNLKIKNIINKWYYV